MEETQKLPQKRVLMLADFGCATGFSQVAENIVKQLFLNKETAWQIDIVAINYHGLPIHWQSLYPAIRLFPAMFTSHGDVFGREGYLNLLASGSYDLTFILQDTFNVEIIGEKIIEIRNKLAEIGKKTFKWIFYFPIDARPKENWITKSVCLADIPVVYTKYGHDEVTKVVPGLKDKLKIVPHGIDEGLFKPVGQKEIDEFRDAFFAKTVTKDMFLVMNINRNQPRKDVARTMAIFSEFKKIVPEAILYLHMKNQDVAYTIDEVARNYNLIPVKDYLLPKNFDEHDGFPIQLVNLMYNCANVVMTTSLGEGWGLSITEAMATKTPVIAPNHTSLTEIIGEDRGTLVRAGSNLSEWITMQADNERFRPLVNIPDFVEKLVQIRNNPEQAKERAENAYQHVLKHWTWTVVGQQWRDIFFQATKVEKKIKIGRNDPCPECIQQQKNVKWKHCREHGLAKNE